ncbi:MAG: hypothetical protein FJ042_04470 [Candidatus Cloacimonetes bacterium]|nr:hypothetical protein [Candidatus Cloacimonadota bacterium]
MRYLGLVWILTMAGTGLYAQEQKSPQRAMVYSLFIPGGGQYYNEQYVKSGIVLGLQTYLGGSAIYHHIKRKEHYRLAMDSEDALQAYHLSKRGDYADRLRNDFWWMGIVSFLSIADALVDAHLSNYEAQRQKVYLKFDEQMLVWEIQF